MLTNRTARSAPRAWAKPRRFACRRRSPMPSRMPAGCASCRFRSTPRRCSARCAPRPTSRSGTRNELLFAKTRRGFGGLPSPLWGGVGGGGRATPLQMVRPLSHRTTPLPTPPPQGGREQTEFVARECSGTARRISNIMTVSMTRTISFTLNGEKVAAEIKPHHNLVELLQREFNLMGARESCGQGMCGCCTVLVNGAAVSGCLYLAAFVDGAEVRTVESLANPNTHDLNPVQEAFIEAGAFQCGYCTPGFVLMTTQLLDAHPDPDEDQIRHYLSGNLCRCGAYPEIVNAVKLAARKRKNPRPA